MKMFSCFRNCLSLKGGNQKGARKKQPVVIDGRNFSYHKQESRGSTYDCDSCKEPGFGPYYISDCRNIYHHKLCGDILMRKSPPISNHLPFPVGRYIFKKGQPSGARNCDACGHQVQGLRYKVWRYFQYRNFHPLCSILPLQIQDPGKPFVLKLEKRIRGQCPLCKGKAKGWAYNSTCGNYSYHVGCMKNEIIQCWKRNEEASENGGNKRGITIRVEIQLPQIQALAEVAIQLIIGALVPNIADIFTVLCRLVVDRGRSH